MSAQRSTILEWLWHVVIAPSRMIMLSSPLPLNEALSRLRDQGKIAQVNKTSEIVIRVPIRNMQRRFMGVVEAESGNRTRLIGRMQTPYRIAMFRIIASLLLFGMALLWLQVGRVWLGVFFFIFGIGFVLSSQYERLWGRDLRLHLEWLRRVLDAE